MIVRGLAPQLRSALADRPVVLLQGAWQVGKSTLAQSLAGETGADYLTFDEPAVLAAAARDPGGFVAGLRGRVVLDEIQRVPELFPAIAAAVDRDRRPGRFLLTASADVMTLAPADFLAGRMAVRTLRPLSEGEIEGRPEAFVDALFAAEYRPPRCPPLPRPELLERLTSGGYPEVIEKRSESRRRAWFASYTTGLLQRDVRDLADIEDPSALPRLLALLASRASTLLNYSELARASGLPASTLKRYFALLERTLLLHTLPAWAGSLSKRLAKSPKILLNDTGLLAHLVGLNLERLEREPQILGPVLESFVALELQKQAAWSATRPALHHFRTLAGQEVDLLLEDAAGRIVGVEVRAGSAVQERDVRALHELAEALGPRFLRGVVLYTGERAVPFGAKIMALPLPALWTTERPASLKPMASLSPISPTSRTSPTP